MCHVIQPGSSESAGTKKMLLTYWGLLQLLGYNWVHCSLETNLTCLHPADDFVTLAISNFCCQSKAKHWACTILGWGRRRRRISSCCVVTPVQVIENIGTWQDEMLLLYILWRGRRIPDACFDFPPCSSARAWICFHIPSGGTLRFLNRPIIYIRFWRIFHHQIWLPNQLITKYIYTSPCVQLCPETAPRGLPASIA